jgi:hypothetical protein
MAPRQFVGQFVAAVACAIVVALGTSVSAAEYRAGELFNLDLSKAVLSPKRIGPPAEFAPVPVEARTDAKQAVVEPKAELKAEPKTELKTERQRIVRTTKVTAPRVIATHDAKPQGAARTKLAHRRNPLEAQAMDRSVQRSIQTWPCKSGGICSWKR